jgi:hypothetical protein
MLIFLLKSESNFPTHYYLAGKVPESPLRAGMSKISRDSSGGNLPRSKYEHIHNFCRRQQYSIMKNLPKYTRASSNERLFKWSYKTHLNLKNINQAISTDITKQSTKESLSRSHKSSITQLSSYNCKCDKDAQSIENQKFCSNAEKWIKYAFEKYSRQFDSERDSQIFYDLITISDESLDINNDLNQIKNDINRTFANEPYFLSPNQGYNKVYDVLKGFTLYDKSCGYVQGMNFIIGSLAYH